MNIERITADGITPELLAMGQLFFDEAHLPGVFNPTYFSNQWQQFITSGVGNMWVAKKSDGVIVGAIAALKHPDVCTGDLVVQEMFWFMHPDHRGTFVAMRLYSAIECWARSLGAYRLCMSTTFAPGCEKLRSLYHKLGFKAVDVFYFKTL